MKNVDELAKKHEYIALVEILKIAPSKLTVRTIRQYKGERSADIKVFGNTIVSHVHVAGNPTVNNGDFWLVFSTKRDQNEFEPFQAIIFSTSEHFIDRSTHSGFYIERRLSEIFNFERLDIYDKIFNSGQTKIEQNYKTKKINGRLTFIYPSGKKYRKEKYKNGKLHGKTIEYFVNGGKSKTICYKNDTIYSIKKSGSNETVLLNRHEEFKNKIYKRGVKKTVLYAQDQTDDKLIRFVKKSKFKNNVITYHYDEYYNDLHDYPKYIQTEFDISVKYHPGSIGQKKREIISKTELKINGKEELIIAYKEFDEDWINENGKIVFYNESYGIFKEIRQNKIFEAKKNKYVKKLIDKTDEIVLKSNF